MLIPGLILNKELPKASPLVTLFSFPFFLNDLGRVKVAEKINF